MLVLFLKSIIGKTNKPVSTIPLKGVSLLIGTEVETVTLYKSGRYSQYHWKQWIITEKSVLQYATKFGWENNISVACCGSNISAYQIQLLLDLGVEEIVIALDRDFEEYGDKVCKSQIKKYEKLNQKYGTICKMSFIFDRYNVLGLKQSPIERTKEIFLKLFKERVIL